MQTVLGLIAFLSVLPYRFRGLQVHVAVCSRLCLNERSGHGGRRTVQDG